MKKFIKTVLLFCILFFIIDKLLYVFLFISPGLEKDDRLEKLINGDLDKEVIVLGSSRGSRNILAYQIEDSLGLSAYNLSYPGTNLDFHKFILETILRFNDTPKIVLLSLDDPTALWDDKSLEFRYERFYPLVRYEYIIDEMIRRGEKNYLAKFFALGRINKSNFIIEEKHFSALDSLTQCGSMPISFQREDHEFSYDSILGPYSKNMEVDSRIESFMEMQRLCAQNKIRFVVVFSPNFRIHNRYFEQRLRQLSLPETEWFVYDTENPVYRDPSFYYDETHLLTKGAKVFTNEIVEYLKEPEADN